MRQADRLDTILERVREDAQVDVNGLVDALGASPATVRRDLDLLAERGLVTRTHGGARKRDSIAYDLPLRYRSANGGEAKAAIAAAAASLIRPGQVVGLSGGTTVTRIADTLAHSPFSKELTVVTNAVDIASQLAMNSDIRVLVVGGVLNPGTYELVGPMAHQSLSGLWLDLAFIGADAFDRSGATTRSEEEAFINRLMASRAETGILTASSSKYGTRTMASIGGPEVFSTVITDDGLDEADRAELEASGFEVQTASDPE
ncbi:MULTISPECIES: DeoR/GlpR family DNA-binding transcription regulator [Tsukamurella]|uniref:DeoR/GlpR family DNA-binding transcription regulator n=1 Tax=Tsukamurella strandjordii TaxID=147577 RepID=A0AA90NAT7_9ACTN|nr:MULTISPECIES: DeoR/GlpR family DNA-binding transcription regulator [Tsukamurella]MDP0397077.1 DeoR/GlpR family DNA-binding transcription regulator [Tsukamurella strandjordii]GIZ96879.1 transcriptional regulator [Tsukamurella sp. TY48]